jgi:hypothetical protein
MGYGAYSSVLSGGPIIETVPDTPSTAPARDEAGTTTTQIVVEMEEVAALSLAAGGSTISSYNLEWNQGSGTQFYELTGETSDSMARLVTVGSLTEGQTYTFRYRVRNIHGWSPDPSPEVEIMAAEKPSAPVTPTTELQGTSAAITWVAPSENGSPILSYLIEIQGSDGGWHQDTVYCDGADPAVISSTTCSIPLTTLTDAMGDFVLAPGALVAVRVSATNLLGMGAASAANSAGAYV